MINIFKYSGVGTKTRVMYGKMLKKSDYNELLNKKTVNDIASYLKQSTYFSSALEAIDERKIHRGELENILKREILKDYKKLLKFSTSSIDMILKIMLRKYEIESLKVLFRIFETEKDVSLSESSLMFIEEYGSADIKHFSQIQSSKELIEGLKGSVYFDVLSPFLSDLKRINQFNIEMALDMYYFNFALIECEKNLTGEDLKIIKNSLGSEIDILNILWIFRSKKYYSMPREIIYSYIIPKGRKIKKDYIEKLIITDSMEEFVNLVRNTSYSSIFSQKNELLFELKSADYSHRLHTNLIRNKSFTIACTMSYLHLKEYELRNIVTIIEGIRYGFEPEKIREYIIGKDYR